MGVAVHYFHYSTLYFQKESNSIFAASHGSPSECFMQQVMDLLWYTCLAAPFTSKVHSAGIPIMLKTHIKDAL